MTDLCSCSECASQRAAPSPAPASTTPTPAELLEALCTVLGLVDRKQFLRPEQQAALWRAEEIAGVR